MFRSSRQDRDEPESTVARRPFRIWGEPLIHFFVLGLVVFGLRGVIEQGEETTVDPLLVEVSSAEIDWFRTMWRKRMGREPTVEELRGQVNQLIREEILSREAVTMGLDEGDTVVRRRLAQRMDFLFRDLSGTAEPSDDELQNYLEENRSTYEIPGQMSFTHVYFNPEKRGDDAAAEAARESAERLNADEIAGQDTSGLGDPFLLPSSYANQSPAELRSAFGLRFADAVSEQEPGTWRGPVLSGYGWHAVLVHDRSEPMLPEFSALKERLTADWMAARERELAGEVYDRLRERYQVLVEGMPYEMDKGG
ncbi:MAG: peptidyl-prolyl cis-trans isomerase [Planctomycetota bacterium]|jgi:hypothetical protein